MRQSLTKAPSSTTTTPTTPTEVPAVAPDGGPSIRPTDAPSLNVVQRHAFGWVGKLLGLKHSGLEHNGKIVSLGNPENEDPSAYTYRAPVKLPEGTTPEDVMRTARERKGAYPQDTRGYVARYLAFTGGQQGGTCNDLVAGSLQAHGTPLPRGYYYQGLHNPVLHQRYDYHLEQQRQDALFAGDIGEMNPLLAMTRALRDTKVEPPN